MLAAIDLGSNSLRALFGTSDGVRVEPVEHYRAVTRLSGGMTVEGLSPAAKERTLFAFQDITRLIQQYQPTRIRCVSTEVLRRAADAASFVKEVQRLTGLALDIVSGEEEASLSAAGVLSAVTPVPDRSAIIDIGGGSTEMLLCVGREVMASASRPLGAVRMLEDYPVIEDRQKAIRGLVEVLVRAVGHDAGSLTLVGTAGTITTLAAIDLAMTSYNWNRINNHRMTLEKIMAIYDRILPLSPAEREELPGLEKGRGDIIVSGVMILLAIMERLGVRELVVSDFGLLEGVLLGLANPQSVFDTPPLISL